MAYLAQSMLRQKLMLRGLGIRGSTRLSCCCSGAPEVEERSGNQDQPDPHRDQGEEREDEADLSCGGWHDAQRAEQKTDVGGHPAEDVALQHDRSGDEDG